MVGWQGGHLSSKSLIPLISELLLWNRWWRRTQWLSADAGLAGIAAAKWK